VYAIDYARYQELVKGPIFDFKLALSDALVPDFKSVKARIWFSSAIVARDEGKKTALWLFEEQPVTFGLPDHLFSYLWPDTFKGVFSRYECYATWSRWSEALYLPQLPVVVRSFNKQKKD
jgi:hypothetical protein